MRAPYVRFFPYTLTLREPLVATSPDGDANTAASYPFLPGSLIRGAVARALEAQAGHQFKELLDILVLSGQVRYLNAYPAVGNYRSLPVPLSLRKEKHGDRVYDLASGCEPEEQLEGLHTPFALRTASDWQGIPVHLSERLHHRRDPRTGRPSRGEGSLFVLTAVEPGQRFAGVVGVFGDSSDQVEARFKQVQEYLRGPLLLGRSRRAGYGGMADLTWGETGQKLEVPRQSHPFHRLLEPNEKILLLLTADYVGRDPETGHPHPRAIERELREHLPVEVEGWFAGYRVVGGYNRKWGLPLPQSLALQAGSVLVLRALEPVEPQRLVAVEVQGLGERQVEGFGRFAFLPVPPSRVEWKPFREAPAQGTDLSVPPLVKEMEARLLWAAVAEIIDAEAAAWAGSVRDPSTIPTPSLLNRLRVSLRSKPDNFGRDRSEQSGLDTLRDWLDEGSPHALRTPAMKQLKNCQLKVGREKYTMCTFLRRLLEADLDQLLDLGDALRKNHLVSYEHARENLHYRLATRARYRLIEALLGALALRRKGGTVHAQSRG